MSHAFPPPLLPLLLWRTPPGLEMILAQEGVPFERVPDAGRPDPTRGRFVLHDGRRAVARRVESWIDPHQDAIDIDALREEGTDPFAALLDTRATHAAWEVAGTRIRERVARVDRAGLRARLLDRLRVALQRHGGVWVRLAAYPHPYRSAFNLRVDLDEPYPDDYLAFARARLPLEDCTTHFVSTHAYGREPRVMDDLRGRDTQSHGHYHVVYRAAASNRLNLRRADQCLRGWGIEPCGFAAPEGRWNRGLDAAIESLGYGYSSEFQVGRDDRPFHPWRGDRFSAVLQVPIHPVCEGLFLEAGEDRPRVLADHFARVIANRIAVGEPAFVYGHPERRLARWPEVLDGIAGTIRGVDLLWRVTLSEFARWWRWRAARRWSLHQRGPDHYEALFEEGDAAFTPALELVRDRSITRLPAHDTRVPIVLRELAHERRPPRLDLPHPRPVPSPWGWRRLMGKALDWETVTPLDDLPADTPGAAIKKAMRGWRERDRS